MEVPESAILEIREQQLMVSPRGENPSSRTAHFLKPTVNSVDKPLPKLPSLPLFSTEGSLEPQDLPLNVTFHGWRSRPRNWTAWVEKMAALHESTWKKAGIYEAIMNSTYRIKRSIGLVLGVAEKWCCETKSFIFPWGEATVTLEDVMVLGGYSVLGSPVFGQLDTEAMKAAEGSLQNERIELVRSKAKKACPRLWMKKFMDGASEFEHEAFLAFWLSRYVFTNAHETIREHVFPVAIQLARGKRVALAPAVLATIYRDLCLLKDAIIASSKLRDEEVFTLTLWSPFQLVQVWAWERFLDLRPKPNLIKPGEPRFARWHDLNFKVENVRLALDSASGSFEWRPYAAVIENWSFPKFYREKELCILTSARLDKELESFARCLRPSELVGIDCMEQYLPNRVAMQFGMDQDIPGSVARSSEITPDIAWSKYNEPISNVKLYIPSRLFKGGVTMQYFEWWKQSFESNGSNKGVQRQKRGQKTSPKSAKSSKGKKEDNKASVCTSFHHNRSTLENIEGKTAVNGASVTPDCSLKRPRKQAESVGGNENGSIAPNSSHSLKKSKSMAQILKGKETASDDSTPPCSNQKTSNESSQNLKGKKKGGDGSGLPLGGAKASAGSLKRKKEANLESSAPGLNPKRSKKPAENPRGNVEDKNTGSSLKSSNTKSVKRKEKGKNDSAVQGSPLRSSEPTRSLKQRKGSNSSVPLDFTPISKGIEAEGSPEENNLTIAEILRSCKKHENVEIRDSDEGRNSSGHSQSFSSTIADDGAVNFLEPLAMLAEKVIQDEAVLQDSGKAVEVANETQKEQRKAQDETMVGGPERTMEDANDSKTENAAQETPSISGSGDGLISAAEVPGSGLSIEERIIRLEKLVAELKAAKSDQK